MSSHLRQRAIWFAVGEQRVFACLVLSLAMGTALNMTLRSPSKMLFCVMSKFSVRLYMPSSFWTYRLFLYTNPLIMFSVIASIAYVHGFEKAATLFSGQLPPYPDVQKREHLFVVLGEVHNQLDKRPSPAPHWLMIPEKGLYTGIAVFGSIGSGKTQSAILPLMRQLLLRCNPQFDTSALLPYVPIQSKRSSSMISAPRSSSRVGGQFQALILISSPFLGTRMNDMAGWVEDWRHHSVDF